MPQDKKFVVSFKTDVKGLKDAYKALNDLAQMGNKVAKAFQGVTLGAGGGVGARGTLSKALIEETKLFKDLGTAGEKLSKIFKDNVVKSQGDLQKALKTTDKDLDTLVKKYEVAERRLATNKLRYRQAKLTSDRDVLFAQLQEKAMDRIQLGAAVEGGAAGAGGGAFGGMGGGLGMLAQMGGGMALQNLGLGGVGRMALQFLPRLALPLAVAAIAGAALKQFQVGAPMYAAGAGPAQIQAWSTISGVRAGYMGAATGQDSGLAIGAGLLERNPEAMRDITHGFWGYGTWGGGLAGLGGMRAFGKSLGAVGSGRFIETLALNLAAGRQAAIKERAEELSATQVDSKMAMDAIMGSYHTRKTMEARYGRGTWERRQANLYGAAETAALYDPASRFAGTAGAVSLANQAAGMFNFGYDPSRVLGILGAGRVAGGVNLVGRRGDVEMRTIMGESAAQYMGLEGMMYQGKGIGLTEAMSNAITQTGGAAGIRQAHMVGIGMALQGRMAGGETSQYQASYNLAAAAAALGPGANPYTINALATQMKDPAVLADIARGRPIPPQLAALGITREQAATALADMQRGMLNRFYDVGTGTGPAFERMRAARTAGSFGKYFKDMTAAARETAIGEMAPLLAQVDIDTFGGDVTKATSYLMAEAGLGGRPAGVGGRRGAAVKPAAAEDDADKLRRLQQENTVALQGVTRAAGALKDAIDGQTRLRRETGLPDPAPWPKPKPRK
jgi:hypothetical protein